MPPNNLRQFNFRLQKATLNEIISIYCEFGAAFSSRIVPVEFYSFATRFGFELDVTASVAGQDNHAGWKIIPIPLKLAAPDIRIGDNVNDKTGQLNHGLSMTVVDTGSWYPPVPFCGNPSFRTW